MDGWTLEWPTGISQQFVEIVKKHRIRLGKDHLRTEEEEEVDGPFEIERNFHFLP